METRRERVSQRVRLAITAAAGVGIATSCAVAPTANSPTMLAPSGYRFGSYLPLVLRGEPPPRAGPATPDALFHGAGYAATTAVTVAVLAWFVASFVRWLRRRDLPSLWLRLKPHRAVAFVVFAYVVLALAYSVLTPIWEAPDEASHYA